MNTSTLSRPTSSKAPCGCGGSGTGRPLPGACGCADGTCTSCQAQGAARPRFFAGQLLTEDDLQALSDYVLEKNRLHNRLFVGDGVVCGLQVTCNPCGGGKLVVQPGHALDCCGNDLVLECAVELDANAMVRDLRRSLLGGYDCGDPCAGRKPAGGKGEETKPHVAARHYSLYIRYSEEATDPVAPYATGEPCGTAACEPTRVREGVRFELRCCTDADAPDGFLQRALRCLSDLTHAEALAAALKKLYQAEATREDVAAAREALLDQLDASPQLADCSLRADVAAIQVPAEGDDLDPARRKLVQAYLRLMRDCLCRAVLPPCPPCDDPGVLLASFELADCDVVNICNLERKLVLTGPNIRYWFPVDLVGELLERLCCPADPCEEQQATPTPAPTATPRPTPPATPQPTPQAVAAAAVNSPQGPSNEPRRMEPSAAADNEILRTMAADHLLRTFSLTRSDASGLGRIRDDLRDLVAAGRFDDVLPVRILRRSAIGSTVERAAARRVVDSPEFRKFAAELTQQHATKLEKTRREIQVENAKVSESMATENQDLRAQLAAVLERLKKLEGAPPHAPDDASRKTRKQ
jgi:hypothetical protein